MVSIDRPAVDCRSTDMSICRLNSPRSASASGLDCFQESRKGKIVLCLGNTVIHFSTEASHLLFIECSSYFRFCVAVQFF